MYERRGWTDGAEKYTTSDEVLRPKGSGELGQAIAPVLTHAAFRQ